MWTLGLLLFITGYLVMKMIEGTFKRIKTPVYPSDTEIDRAIPPEILEQIFINLDYESFIACSRVSKYWKYLSSNKQLSRQICNYDAITESKRTRSNLYEQCEYDADVIDGLHWLTYSDSYDPEWRIQDLVLARKLDKQLLDIHWNSVTTMKYAIIRSSSPLTKCLVKFRCVVQNPYYNNLWICKPLVEDNKMHEYTLLQLPKPKNVPCRANAVCEVIIDFTEVNAHPVTKVHRFRYIESPPSLFGVDRDLHSFLWTGLMLFTPCFLADYWNSSETMQRRVNFWFAVIVVYLTSIVYIGDDVKKLKGRTPNRKIYFLLELAMLPASMVFWSWTLELGLLVGCLMGCAIYIGSIRHSFDMNHPLAKEVTTIAALLWLLILDWKLLADSIRSGVIIHAISHNMILYIIAATLSLVLSGIGYSLTNDRQFLTNVFWDWRFGRWRDYCKAFFIMLFVTMYSPNAMWKLQQE